MENKKEKRIRVKVNLKTKKYLHAVYCLLIANLIIWLIFALPMIKEFHADYTTIKVWAANEEVSAEAGASSPKIGSEEWVQQQWEDVGVPWEEV